MELGMDQPKQRLKRIEDPSGSSAGWWALQDWPGLVVAKMDEGWAFYFHPQTLWPDAGCITMDKLERTELLYFRYRLQCQRYTTRREALQALAALLESSFYLT